MTNAIFVSVKDLRFVEVACPHCHRGIVFDLDRAKAELPEACGDCGAAFDPETRETCALLARAYQTRNQRAPVRFRVEA